MVYWMTRLLVWLAGRVPRGPRMWLAGALTELVYFAWVTKRRVTIANMAQVLAVAPTDPKARWAARRTWRNYGRYVADFFYLPNTTPAAVVARLRDMTPAPGWRARLEKARADGRGVLLATAHFGNWDAAGVIIGSEFPLHAIAETFADPRMNELVVAQRAALGITVIPMERMPRRMLRLLQEGGIVGTPVDRPLPAGEGVPIVFFGRRCYVPGGIAQLALRTGSAIVAGFVWCDEVHSPTYYGYMTEPIIPEPSGDRDADVIALTQRLYDDMADIIRRHPTQWYMFRSFWPAEEAHDATASGPQAAAPARDRLAATAPSESHVEQAAPATSEGPTTSVREG